ncbi:MAG: hypothetical protein QGH60_01740 [Phycisphaerae bacterium]|jgi:hypothetical protein|nr:hypothetical protein [Phycisphaerae bacterium]
MVTEDQTPLPRAEAVREAVDIYVSRAYPDGADERISEKFTVPDDCDLAEWLIETVGEPEPADADIGTVRSIALRLGNAFYPNMKLRLTRPPGNDAFVLMVDSHDVMLIAPPGSPDYQALEELKGANAAIAGDITGAWDAAGLPTERNYLRDKIRQARERGEQGDI